jgi:hypothetical protein
LTTKVSGTQAARTSRPSYLTVAPEPGGLAVTDPQARFDALAATPGVDSAEALIRTAFNYGYDAGLNSGRSTALAEQIDVRVAALAGLDRLDDMTIEELDQLIELANGVVYAKRHARPALCLVDETDDLAAPAYPRFVVQATTDGRHQVVPVDPGANGRPVQDGADIISFADAAALRDRLNAPAVTA